MSTKYTVRVASPVAYEYWEAEADTFEELLSAEQELRELKAAAGGDVSPAQGVANVKSAFGKTTQVTTSGNGFGQKSGGFGGNQGKQESAGEDRYLGEHKGYKITVKPGKFGYYFNAYSKGANPERINRNLPKGADPASVTLQDAVETLSEAA